MNPFAWIVSGGKTVNDVMDKDNGLLSQVGGWVGNSQFTAEEQAELNAKNITAIHGFVVATLDENTERSKARRDIAVFFIKFYSLMLFMCGMTYPINPEWAEMWFRLATSLAVGGLVSAISIFFFGSHIVRAVKKPSL